MKKIAFALLGLFLAAMAVTCIVHGDPFGIAFGIAFAAGAWRSFGAVRRLARPKPAEPTPRPWDR